MRRPIIALAMLALLGGCSAYKAPNNAFHKALQAPYKLDSGDVLNIAVYEQAELSRSYSVDRAGKLAFPLVGSVQARGMTVKQLEAGIAAKLRGGFLRNPDVSVEVAQYRPFYIMGEVGRAGQYAYVPGMTIQNAIASAGGFSARGNQNNADVTRHINGEIATARISINDPIMPGDTIYIRERLF